LPVERVRLKDIVSKLWFVYECSDVAHGKRYVGLYKEDFI
jgi:hypothetical protein